MEIPILYEDDNIVAVEKPAGLVVHPDGKTDEPALTDWILKKYPQAKDVGEPITATKEGVEQGVISRPGIVHRLDRGTSGVLLVAKTAPGHATLKEQFQNQLVKKKYLTFVYGDLKDAYGIIDKPIGKSPRDFRRWSAGRGARGEMRPAETWWTLISYRGGYSFVEVEPKTGRTHQIRVHFKAIQHPVACDTLYAPDKKCDLPIERVALHASSITFTNCEGKNITVKSPLPKDFVAVLEELGMTEVAKKKGVC